MAALIVIGFDNQVNARAAYDETVALQTEFIIDLRGVAIVTVDAEGETHVETPQKIVGTAATSGALWGMLVGLLFFVPFLGAALGGATGALIGKLAKSGINDTFRNQVQALLQPGNAAVVVLVEATTEDTFIRRMAPYGGRLLKILLSEQDEKELARNLGETD